VHKLVVHLEHCAIPHVNNVIYFDANILLIFFAKLNGHSDACSSFVPSYWFSWERTRHLCQLRRRYVQLYATLLQQAPCVDISEIRQIEKILDSKVVILWRCDMQYHITFIP
jgi:hypothetical protein